MWWCVWRSGCDPSHSVEKLHALVVELVEANADLRKVIAAKDDQIACQERRIAELEQRLGPIRRIRVGHRRRIRRIASRCGVPRVAPRGVGRVSSPGNPRLTRALSGVREPLGRDRVSDHPDARWAEVRELIDRSLAAAVATFAQQLGLSRVRTCRRQGRVEL